MLSFICNLQIYSWSGIEDMDNLTHLCVLPQKPECEAVFREVFDRNSVIGNLKQGQNVTLTIINSLIAINLFSLDTECFLLNDV